MTDSQLAQPGASIHLFIIHSSAAGYFGFIALRNLWHYLYPGTIQARPAFSDVVVVSLFLAAAAVIPLTRLLSQRTGNSCLLERTGAIILLSSSAISFVYFQFYYDKWPLILYLAFIIFFGARYMSTTAQHMADSRALCLGYGLLILVPAIHASLLPTACRLPMVPQFVAYMAFNGFAGLIHIMGIPDILLKSEARRFSEVFMHAGIMLAAVYLSNQLLLAKESTETFLFGQCGKLV